MGGKEVGEGEDLGGGEAGDGGAVGVGEVEEFLEGVVGVVLGDDLELLGEEPGTQGAVGVEFFGLQEGLDFLFGEVEGCEHVVELGGGVGEIVEKGADGVVGGGLCVVIGDWHGFPPGWRGPG